LVMQWVGWRLRSAEKCNTEPESRDIRQAENAVGCIHSSMICIIYNKTCSQHKRNPSIIFYAETFLSGYVDSRILR
jgi:hypothetical protein